MVFDFLLSNLAYFRTLRANKPCGRIIRIATIASRVRTLAIDPDMKNSIVDCACEMVKAEAMVPSRLAAPPNTTTNSIQVLQDQANLDQAGAAVREAQVALEQVNIRAPFSGVFDHRDAEIGAYLAPGQPCGTVIELDPLLIVGNA